MRKPIAILSVGLLVAVSGCGHSSGSSPASLMRGEQAIQDELERCGAGQPVAVYNDCVHRANAAKAALEGS